MPFAVCILFIVLSISTTCFGAQPDGGLPGSFTRYGVGARALGLGGAFAGIADDASAIFWNPAGLSLLMKPELTATHITLFEKTSADFVGFGLPLKGLGSLGAGYLRQASGGFERRATAFDTPTGFSITNSMMQLGWAIRLPAAYTLNREISMGVGVKRVAQQIDTVSGSGIGADAGLLYRHKKGFSLGIVVQNIQPPAVSMVSKAVPFPRIIDIAPAYARAIGEDLQVTLAARTNYFDGRLHPAGGSELCYLNKVTIRAGMEAKGVSTGIGVRISNFQLDYTVLLHEIAINNVISVSLKFGKTGIELAEEIKRGMKRLDRDEAKRIARSYYQEGMILAKEGNLSAAVGNLEKADLLDPTNKQIEEKLEGLRAEFARQINRQLSESSVILARQQYQQGNILVSLEYWKAALQIEPGNEEAQRSIETIKSGLERQEREILARAGTQEKEILARAQKDAIDLQVFQCLSRAQGLREQGHLVEAVAEAKKALEVDSGNERVRSLLAELEQATREKVDQLSRQAALEEEKKDFKASVAAYQAILQMAPASPGVNEKLRVARASVNVNVKPELKKEAERLYYVAVDQYLKKQYLESSKTLSRIFELDPDNQGAAKLKAKLAATLK